MFFVYVLTEESLLPDQHYQCQHFYQDKMSSVAFPPKPIWADTAKENFYIIKSVLLRSKRHAVLVNYVSHEIIHPTIYSSKFLRCEIINISRKLTINAFFLARDIVTVSILKIFKRYSGAWELQNLFNISQFHRYVVSEILHSSVFSEILHSAFLF